MCQTIYINKGEKEIQSPREFLEHFGFIPDRQIHYNSVEMDCCLCQCDLDKTFKEKNIPFKKYCGDFFVGQLDMVVGDDD